MQEFTNANRVSPGAQREQSIPRLDFIPTGIISDFKPSNGKVIDELLLPGITTLGYSHGLSGSRALGQKA